MKGAVWLSIPCCGTLAAAVRSPDHCVQVSIPVHGRAFLKPLAGGAGPGTGRMLPLHTRSRRPKAGLAAWRVPRGGSVAAPVNFATT